MKYNKGTDGSYLHNCCIIRRNGDPSNVLFHSNKTISAFLNGYAIIPMEKYARLVEIAMPSDIRLKSVVFSKEQIKEADRELHINEDSQGEE